MLNKRGSAYASQPVPTVEHTVGVLAGERLSPWVAIFCIAMGVVILFG